jgi:arylformamidase
MALSKLEAEYNNRLKVPEHGAIMAGWQSRAAAFRQNHPHVAFDVPYGGTPREKLDLFWPDATRCASIAMFIHGGYWQALDKSWFSHLARGFLANGLALAVPSYNLCPHVTLATLIEQVRDAGRFLIERFERDIYATGHSAGGHLAAMLLATDWPRRTQAGRVSGATAISGLFDLVPLTQTSINGALGLDEAEARRLSPVTLDRPQGGIQTFVGEWEGDEYLRQSQSIAQAWGGTCGIIPDADHFTAIAPLEDGSSPMMRAIRQAVMTAGKAGRHHENADRADKMQIGRGL